MFGTRNFNIPYREMIVQSGILKSKVFVPRKLTQHTFYVWYEYIGNLILPTKFVIVEGTSDFL